VQALIREAALREWDSLPEACALRLLMGRFVISIHPSIDLSLYISLSIFYLHIYLTFYLSFFACLLYTRALFI
jgi:hypothetical protein